MNMPLDSITKARHTTLDDIVKCKYEKEKRELMEKNVKILVVTLYTTSVDMAQNV